METLNINELMALIQLLEDPNDTIYEEIMNKILMLGNPTLPHLQEAYDSINNDLQKERLQYLLEELKLPKFKEDILKWKETHSEDLLKGIIIIAQYEKPNIDLDPIHTHFENLVKDIDEKITEDHGDRLQAQIFNEVILGQYNFKGNSQDYAGINNSLINKVVETKRGNPIMLCIQYLLAAKKLNVSFVGINSPRHFIIGSVSPSVDIYQDTQEEIYKHIDFYVDPFNGGIVYSYADFEKMLKTLKFDPALNPSLIATNVDIVRRVLNNLIYGYHKQGQEQKAKNLLEIVELL